MVPVVTETPKMEDIIISDADFTLLNQILKSPSPMPSPETKIRQQLPTFSQVSYIF